MKKFFYLFLTFILFCIASSTHAASKTTVRMTSQGFEPKEITIQQGDTVIFENSDSEFRWPASNVHPTHQIYPEFDPKAEIAPGSSWEFTFDQVGTWKYHDHLLPQHSGTIIVQGNNDNLSDEALAKSDDQTKVGFWQKIGAWFKSVWNWFIHLGKHKENETKSSNQTVDISKYNLDIGEKSEDIFKDDIALGSYLKKYGAHKTITALRLLEPKFGSCHQPAHRAGHIGYQLFGDKAFVEYSAECQSGYYHGVMEAYFIEHGSENLKQSLATLCRGGLNDFFEHQCIHGIGHGLMAWTNYELPEALSACDELPKRPDSCWTGVFMENFSAKLATDKTATPKETTGNTDTHITKYLRADDALYPCNDVAKKYQNSCYFLQTSRMLQIFGQDFRKVADSCRTAPKEYQYSCYSSMGRDVGGSFANNNARQISECNYAPVGTNRQACINGAVQNSFWDPTGAPKAVDFCARLSTESEKKGCYTTIFERATQLLTSRDAQESFCASVEQAYQPKCTAEVAHG